MTLLIIPAVIALLHDDLPLSIMITMVLDIKLQVITSPGLLMVRNWWRRRLTIGAGGFDSQYAREGCRSQ
jgi:hypothetical protein